MAFTVLIEDCAEFLKTLSLPDFYEELLIRTGYVTMLESKDDVESRARLENVRELKSSIVSYCENTDLPTLAGFLEEIALYTDIEQYDAEADAVVMMTMHAAKGLEFPHVFLVGLEEGLFPGTRSLGDPEEMEEERRLCYVAITRAKQSLTICYARTRMLYGRTTTNIASRFVDEIPPSVSIGPSSRNQNTTSRATTAASAGFPSTETTNRFPRARQGRARREEAILPWCRRQRKKRQRCSFPRARWCSTRRSGAVWS